jgi:hypothetical protein
MDRFVVGFATRLRAEADRLLRLGCTEAAATARTIAEELEAEFERWRGQELSIPAAAAESGYSEERLRELVRAGDLPAVRDGLRGRLRVRRGDLPRRAPSGVRRAEPTDDLEHVAKRLMA